MIKNIIKKYLLNFSVCLVYGFRQPQIDEIWTDRLDDNNV